MFTSERFPVAQALGQGAEIVITGRVTDTGAGAGADDSRIRLEGRRLGQARRRDHRRAYRGMRRAMHRRQLPGGLGNDSEPGRYRLSDHRSRARRRLSSSPSTRAPADASPSPPSRSSCSTKWAIRANTSRRIASPISRPFISSRPVRTACASAASRDAQRPSFTRYRSAIRPDSRPSGRWCMRGRTRTRRLARRNRFCGRGWTGWDCVSKPMRAEFLGANACHGIAAAEPPPEIEPHLPEVVLRFGVRGENRAAVERFTREIAAAGAERAAGGVGARQRTAAGGRDRGVLAGADSEDARFNRR